MKPLLCSLLAWFCLLLGGIGVFLPILPTTPFVLCAAFLFSISNPRMRHRLEQSKVFGEYLHHYREKGGISTLLRWRSLLVLWTTLGISAYFAKSVHLRLLLAVVCLGVSIHLFLIPGKKGKTETQPEQSGLQAVDTD